MLAELLKDTDVCLVIIRMVTIKVMLGQQGKNGKRLTVIGKKLPLDTLFSSTQAPLLFRFNSTVRFQ